MTLIDTEMAAVMIQSSERRVRRLVERGVLSNYGSDRRVLVSVEEINARIDDGTIHTATR